MKAKSLEERIQRVEDLHEIQNLMSRYEYLHTAGLHEETAELFAKKTPGVRAELPSWGVYEGTEGIKRMFADVHKFVEGDRLGVLNVLPLTTPLIEVAGDGKTAKGLWISPGIETMKVEGKLQAFWAWPKYAVDFVKEDGKWKFWHMHIYVIIHTPYDQSWVESARDDMPFGPIPKELEADRPVTYHWMYNPKIVTENVPKPPEPYETFDEDMAC